MAEGGAGGWPLLIVCHGFTAHRTGAVSLIRPQVRRAGVRLRGFNFSHNGMGPVSKRSTELEKFSRNTIG